jgi:GNAT superfamily N-acetyltransferase
VLRLRALEQGDLEGVAALWNAHFAAAHPLGPRALERWWRSPDTDPSLTFAAARGGRLVGVLLARAPQRAWSPPGIGHVALVAVAPEAQRTGVGAALWNAASDALRERGVRILRLGADPDHLLPGVPTVAPDATWRFLLARGMRFGGVECDLHLDLRAGAPDHPCAGRLVDDDPERALEFVARTFPGRWRDDVAAFAAAGCTVLALERGGETVGFAAAFEPGDAVLGPSLLWSDALPGRPAGLGPLGIDASQRGLGLGIGLVAAAARWHRERGAQDLVIDWTTLTSFYGKLGARVWRVYQRGEASLAAD